MTYADLLKHFGSQGAIARALGVSQASVCGWKKKGIPPLRQLQTETLTRAQLRADPAVYEIPTNRASNRAAA
jgi:hypothetical protein